MNLLSGPDHTHPSFLTAFTLVDRVLPLDEARNALLGY
jgi:hypothetical protein